MTKENSVPALLFYLLVNTSSEIQSLLAEYYNGEGFWQPYTFMIYVGINNSGTIAVPHTTRDTNKALY